MSAKTVEERGYEKVHQALLINGMTHEVATFLADLWREVERQRRFLDSVVAALDKEDR